MFKKYHLIFKKCIFFLAVLVHKDVLFVKLHLTISFRHVSQMCIVDFLTFSNYVFSFTTKNTASFD